MNPIELLQSIYLGDRACKSILIDSWVSEVVLTVDLISRVREPTGHWNFYSDENIVDGRLVFTGVSYFSVVPNGLIPNDLINQMDVRALDKVSKTDNDQYEFLISIDSVDTFGNHTEVEVKIVANGFHLEDPKQPSIEIID